LAGYQIVKSAQEIEYSLCDNNDQAIASYVIEPVTISRPIGRYRHPADVTLTEAETVIAYYCGRL
jgi:hypothetical protein